MNPIQIAHVRQQDNKGCMIACCAMLMNEDYQVVKAELFDNWQGPQGTKWFDRGVTIDHAASYLYTKGYIGHTEYQTEYWTQKKRRPEDWIKPFAPVHILTIMSSGMSHALVWHEGKVYDPSSNTVLTIDEIHSDNMRSITGFWPIPKAE